MLHVVIESLCFSLHLVVTFAVHQTPGGPGTRGTDSWLDDTDKNFGPDLPITLLLKVHYVNLAS